MKIIPNQKTRNLLKKIIKKEIKVKMIKDLPWGWISQNKAFVEKIQNEYSYFLNTWLDSRKKSPKEHYSALKSFIIYLEDVEKLCKTKGECFEFWYYEILTSRDYLKRRKRDLKDLETILKGGDATKPARHHRK